VTVVQVRGTVRDAAGATVDGARVRLVHDLTGASAEGAAAHGRYVLGGIEPGGPYTLVVRRVGYQPATLSNITLRLGEDATIDVVLTSAAARVDTLATVAVRSESSSPSVAGAATTVSDSLLHRLPTINRGIYDFVVLAPQVSTRVGLAAGGMSAGGASLRFNNFLIDGAPERIVTGNSAPAYGGGKSVPIEAVKEYQVLVAPFDVRYGDFAGGLVNTVTNRGTNEFRGTAFTFWRNNDLSRQRDATADVTAAGPYDRWQYGALFSGPILRDRIHFLVAPEWQHLTQNAVGPYLGQPSTSVPLVPVTSADVSRLSDVLRGFGFTPGSGGAVTTPNPLTNLFARVDIAIPEWSSRVEVMHNEARNDITNFSRASVDTFALSSYRSAQVAASELTQVHVYSVLPRQGSYNEVMVWLSQTTDRSVSDVREPVIVVPVPNTYGSTTILKAGAAEPAQGVSGNASSIGINETVTLAMGAAGDVTLGARAERFGIGRGGVSGDYGTWTFSSLDSLARRLPDRFDSKLDLGGADQSFYGSQFALYVGDRWLAGDRFTVTLGLRSDALVVTSRAPYAPAVDSVFHRRTDQVPAARPFLSPRASVDWQLDSAGTSRIRGGLGIFTGRPPLFWLETSAYSYGTGIATLRCGSRATDAGGPPGFSVDPSATPTTCANGSVGSGHGDVDLVDRHLRMAQTARADVGYDQRLPGDVTATAEALVSRGISDFVFVNMNLLGPVGTDRRGRVLYGSIAPTGAATPGLRSDFSEVIDLRNTSAGHALQLSTSLKKDVSRFVQLSAAYTFTRVRDVETPVRAGLPGAAIWSAARTVSGAEDALPVGISLNDLPHRIVLATTIASQRRRWTTDASFFYVGESGSPLTYVAWGTSRRGDLNADGAVGNDPIYVPTSAFDPNEIVFSGVSDSVGADNAVATQGRRVGLQQAAFQHLIDQTPCLRVQRGEILSRNSCREPWSNTTVLSLRQRIPTGGDRALTAEVDVFNVLNLLNAAWGLRRIGDPQLLEQVGETSGGVEVAQPIFRYDVSRPQWLTSATESAYQLQFAIRYSF
jgi:hypothetical protein